jgi:hypothetical protein
MSRRGKSGAGLCRPLPFVKCPFPFMGTAATGTKAEGAFLPVAASKGVWLSFRYRLLDAVGSVLAQLPVGRARHKRAAASSEFPAFGPSTSTSPLRSAASPAVGAPCGSVSPSAGKAASGFSFFSHVAHAARPRRNNHAFSPPRQARLRVESVRACGLGGVTGDTRHGVDTSVLHHHHLTDAGGNDLVLFVSSTSGRSSRMIAKTDGQSQTRTGGVERNAVCAGVQRLPRRRTSRRHL